MKLLITTQAVDAEDPVLGFFHGWLTEFSNRFESIEVICLREGVHELPQNVHVHSLGKEEGVSRMTYLYRYFWYLFTLRRKYDAVFSHMNPHYIVLAGWVLWLRRVPMYFWRNHARMNLMTRIASFFARKVFYTSRHSCTSVFPHAVQMPVGINTDLFTGSEETRRTDASILFLGRLSPVKRLDVLIDVARTLSMYNVHVYGAAVDRDGEAYVAEQKSRASNNTYFHGPVRNDETPAIYQSFELYLNLTPNGSFDKTILEAGLCGALPIVMNESLQGILPEELILQTTDVQSICERITAVHALSVTEKKALRATIRTRIVEQHSLRKLGEELYAHIANGKNE